MITGSDSIDEGRNRPAFLAAASLCLIAVLAACAPRPPALVPPAGRVEAVEGFGSVALKGEAVLKGRFAFLFRSPGRGRIEALDPLGRAAFTLFLEEDRAAFALPRERVYAEDSPSSLMTRILGFAILPDDMIDILCGAGAGAGRAADPEAGWVLETDARGRVVAGTRDDVAFSVREFFPGGGVPREIAVSGPAMTGRLKVLSLRFNPPERAEAFDTSFLRGYSLKTWEGIEEILRR
jgi:hypothetical protein